MARRVDHDLDLVRLRELPGELAEGGGEAVVAQRDRLERERQRAQRARRPSRQCSSARVQRAQALVDLARLDRVVRGLDDQPDAGDALLRPVVQRQGEPPALALLDAQEAVGEAAALALAQLGLDAQRLGEREEARVVRGAHGGRREDAQLRALDGAEGAVGAAQHGQGAGLQRRNGQGRDLDGAAVGRGERGGEVGGAGGIERRPGRQALPSGALVTTVQRLSVRSSTSPQSAETSSTASSAMRSSRRPSSSSSASPVVAASRRSSASAWALSCSRSARSASTLRSAARREPRARSGEHPEHAEGDRKQDVQDDLVDAHARSIPPCTRHYSMIDSRSAIATACVRLSASSFARM